MYSESHLTCRMLRINLQKYESLPILVNFAKKTLRLVGADDGDGVSSLGLQDRVIRCSGR